MAGKIMIVDGVATNRITLKTKMNAAFYEVVSAASCDEALTLAKTHRPDLILMNTRLPEGSGLAACAYLKANQVTQAIPVVLIAPSMSDYSKIEALRAGADELLLKPLDDAVMLARIRSLLRSRNMEEELRLQEGAARALGLAEPETAFETRPKALLVTGDPASGLRWKYMLSRQMPYDIGHACIHDALRGMNDRDAPDIFVMVLTRENTHDGLRLLTELRARAATRDCGVLLVLPASNPDLLVEALDLGANDVMVDGLDMEEMTLRLSALVSRKRVIGRLRNRIHDGLRAAVTDPLTGLFNRRYAMPHLAKIAENALLKGDCFAIMVADLDHFKRVNDRYGHAAGDAVLIEVASRLRNALNHLDLVARIGGEEFLIAIPDTDLAQARQTARTLCALIADEPVRIPEQDLSISVTISIGVAIGGEQTEQSAETPVRLLDSADRALFGAKAMGRNRVTMVEPAS